MLPMSIFSAATTILQAFTGDPREAIARVIRADPQWQTALSKSITFLGAGFTQLIHAALLPRPERDPSILAEDTLLVAELLAKYELDLATLTVQTELTIPRQQLVSLLFYFTPDYEHLNDARPLSTILQEKYAACKKALLKKIALLQKDPRAKKFVRTGSFATLLVAIDHEFETISSLITTLVALEKKQTEH